METLTDLVRHLPLKMSKKYFLQYCQQYAIRQYLDNPVVFQRYILYATGYKGIIYEEYAKETIALLKKVSFNGHERHDYNSLTRLAKLCKNKGVTLLTNHLYLEISDGYFFNEYPAEYLEYLRKRYLALIQHNYVNLQLSGEDLFKNAFFGDFKNPPVTGSPEVLIAQLMKKGELIGTTTGDLLDRFE